MPTLFTRLTAAAIAGGLALGFATPAVAQDETPPTEEFKAWAADSEPGQDA